MNKYQKALNVVKGCIDIRCDEELAILQELVDKSKPKEIIKERTVYTVNKSKFTRSQWQCPTCGNRYTGMDQTHKKHCFNCGQRLDWSNITIRINSDAVEVKIGNDS